jgi:hypothetical protein
VPAPRRLDVEGVLARAHERYRAILENQNSEAIEDVPAARACIGALLGGEIRLHPMPQGSRGPGRLRRAGAAHAGAPRGRGRRGGSI